MEENNHDLNNTTPAPLSPDPKKKHSLSKTGLAIIFIACFVITIFSPNQGLSAIMFFVMFFVGCGAGATVFDAVIHSVNGRGPTERFFATLIGLAGAAFIILISFIAGLLGNLKFEHGD